MDILQAIGQNGGDNSILELARSVGIAPDQARSIISAVGPALARSLNRQTESRTGLNELKSALSGGSHSRFIDLPESVSSPDAISEGKKILGHLFGSKEVSRNVAAKAAEGTNVSADLIKKALPMVAGLAMSALSKSTNKGESIGDSVRDGGGGALSAILGTDEIGIDDVLSLARKFM